MSFYDVTYLDAAVYSVFVGLTAIMLHREIAWPILELQNSVLFLWVLEQMLIKQLGEVKFDLSTACLNLHVILMINYWKICLLQEVSGEIMVISFDIFLNSWS